MIPLSLTERTRTTALHRDPEINTSSSVDILANIYEKEHVREYAKLYILPLDHGSINGKRQQETDILKTLPASTVGIRSYANIFY